MRRLSALAFLIALTLSAGPVAAQQQYTTPGPGGVIAQSGASVSCTNTTTACTLWTYTIPQGFFATARQTNQTPAVGVSPPLHLSMRGLLTTNTGTGVTGTLNVGVNFGGTTATIALVNGYTVLDNYSNRPVFLDVWLQPLATAVSANTMTLYGTLRVGADATTGTVLLATETSFNASVIGTTTLNVARTLAVNWLWGSASQTNAARFYQRSLQIGN